MVQGKPEYVLMPPGPVSMDVVKEQAAAVLPHTSGGAEESKESACAVHAPNFDLEVYAARYTGLTKLNRLIFIAGRCKELELDAYRIALDVLKKGINTDAYRKIASKVGASLGSAYEYDGAWVEGVERRAAQIRERLDGDLASSRTNMMKESIRMGFMDLGNYYYQRGDTENALKNYIRTRDYCHTTRHNIEMCLNVITVAVDSESFVHVNSHVLKAEHTPDISQADQTALSKLKAAAGLAQLAQGSYTSAARKFLECSSSHFTSQGQCFSQVISAEDVAVYGGLCGLATLSREDLKSKVIDNPMFKGFLDLVPQVRELLHDYHSSRFGSCLHYLKELKPELLLDLHFHQHVDKLFKKIRERCLVQFFAPFMSVDLRRMATAFDCDLSTLEAEISQLIMADEMPARIDSQNKTLHRKQVDQREAGYQRVFTMGQDFVRELSSLLLRMSLLESNIIVEGKAGRLPMMPSSPMLDPEDSDHRQLMSLNLPHYEENLQDAMETGHMDAFSSN